MMEDPMDFIGQGCGRASGKDESEVDHQEHAQPPHKSNSHKLNPSSYKWSPSLSRGMGSQTREVSFSSNESAYSCGRKRSGDHDKDGRERERKKKKTETPGARVPWSLPRHKPDDRVAHSRQSRSNPEDRLRCSLQTASHHNNLGMHRIDCCQESERSKPFMGYRKMIEIEALDSNETIVALLSSKSGFKELLQVDVMKPDRTVRLLGILEKACSQSSYPSHQSKLLDIIRNSSFMKSVIPNYLTEMSMEQSFDRQCSFQRPLLSLLIILKVLLTRVPESYIDVMLVVNHIDGQIKSLGSTSAIVTQQIEEELSKVIQLRNNLAQQFCTRARDAEGGTAAEWPDSLRDKSIFPQIEDMTNKKPFLRANKVQGKFQDVETYLDIHFRLLCEDFVGPLRESIEEYLDIKTKPGSASQMQNVKFYHGVRVLHPVCAHNGIMYRIKFDVSKMKRINWKISKRLIFGALLCLSNDDFKTLLFATVSNREPKDLVNGELEVRFESHHNDHSEWTGLTAGDIFTMVETSAYFEAYRHVLKALQHMNETNFPFQKYIIKCELSKIKPPAYLLDKYVGSYDLTPLFKESVSTPLLTTTHWPRSEYFDDSQLEAVRTALTKELAVIQGPPGTGKTYVGLKIVEVLLRNKTHWRDREDTNDNTPIFIVCYTNHALDQFLEGIHKFEKSGIVRVGGRSKSTVLQNCILKNLRKEKKRNKVTPMLIFRGLRDTRIKMNSLRNNINRMTARIEETKSYVKIDYVKDFMGDHLYEGFLINDIATRKSNSKGTYLEGSKYNEMCDGLRMNTNPPWSVFLDWLGLSTGKDVCDEHQEGPEDVDDNSNDYWEDILVEDAATMHEQFYIDDVDDNNMTPVQQEDLRCKLNRTNAGHIDVDENIDDNNITLVQQEDLRCKLNRTNAGHEDVDENVDDNNMTPVQQEDLRCKLNRANAGYEDVDENSNDDYEEFLVEDAATMQDQLYIDDIDDDNVTPVQQEDLRCTLNRAYAGYEDVDENSNEEATAINDIGDDNMTAVQPEDLRCIINRAKAKKTWEVNVNKIDPDQIDHIVWRIQDNNKDGRNKIMEIMRNTDAMTEVEVGRVTDVWTLSVVDRRRLYRFWINKYIRNLKDNMRSLQRRYDREYQRLQEINMQNDVHIMRSSTILGMTTTCAAKYKAALQQIKPKIVIVEEAAEVFEAHIVTSLSEGCQHLILIGDHKQLRPSANVDELAKRFNLEISLFERLVVNNIAHNCLQRQHRMRPIIAKLMRPIYPDLENDDSVNNFDDIRGVSKNLFFINHGHHETFNEELKGKSNIHEAKYITALCRYLVLQGYSVSQITVLTFYFDQLLKIQEYMKRSECLTGVRSTTVDNFQGEENDIILLSLVRSNPNGNIGFLSVENRVCVALSRARKGMFVIGNFDLLESNIKTTLWRDLVRIAKQEKFIGNGLILRCENHTDKTIHAKSAEDFRKAPDGGCTQPCTVRLECGHSCPKRCHRDEHYTIKCKKVCDKKLCTYNHKCKKKCYQMCDPCAIRVPKKMPTCGHEQLMECHMHPSEFTCQEKCIKLLTGCGHTCKEKCGEPCTIKCSEVVTRQGPCGHNVETECYWNSDNFKCPQTCQTKLLCGHDCVGTCDTCRQGRLHVSCKQSCGRTLVCGHFCKEPCTSNCPPCQELCQNRCKHSKCTRQCGKPCIPCKERCEWGCRHHKCDMLCSEPCNRPRCDQPCRSVLKCGHPCIGICGEICPKLCRICDKNEVTEIFFGNEDEESALFVELEDCGHVFEMSGLDKWMDLAEDTSSGKVEIQMKTCPRCKTVIRCNRRYGTILNQILVDIEAVKRQMVGDDDILKKEVDTLREELMTSGPDSLLNNLLSMLERPYYTLSMMKFYVLKTQFAFVKQIRSLGNKVKKDILKWATFDGIERLSKHPGLDEGINALQENVCTGDENVGYALLADLSELEEFVVKSRNHISDQETSDINTELVRMSLTVNYHILRMNSNHNKPPEVDVLLSEVGLILTNGRRVDSELEKEIKAKLQEVNKLVGGLGITDEDRVQIVKAMGFGRKGHWFKCPNNHVYAIGECGGASEESTCPECKEKIGGMNHRLLDTNHFAPEMDGAAYPAWSEAANLGNYGQFQ